MEATKAVARACGSAASIQVQSKDQNQAPMQSTTGRVTPIKVFSKVWSVLTALILLALVAIIVALVGVRLFGIVPYSVLTGSMTPVYPPGSIVYVQETSPDEIHVGDVITCQRGLYPVTHRVVRLDRDQGFFITKGDANKDIDNAPVAYDEVLGKVVYSLPYLGGVATQLTTVRGAIACFALVMVLLAMLYLVPLLIGALARSSQSDSDPPGSGGVHPTTRGQAP